MRVHSRQLNPEIIKVFSYWLASKPSFTYSNHALSEAKKDDIVTLPTKLKNPRVVEVGLRDGNIKFLVCRADFSTDNDIVLVIDVISLTVVTCWLNLVTDHHETLDLSRYIQSTQTIQKLNNLEYTLPA